MNEGAFETTFAAELEYDQMPYLLTEFMRKSPPWGSGRVGRSGPQNVWDQLHDAPQTRQAEATFTGKVDYDQIIRGLKYARAADDMRDAMITAWGKAITQEGSKPMAYDHIYPSGPLGNPSISITSKQEGSKQMEPGEYSYPMSDIKITFNSTPYKKQVKDYLDPNGCHQCYVLRSKYVKLAGLKVDQTLGADDVALVRCPKHEREYVSGIKTQLTDAVAKIG